MRLLKQYFICIYIISQVQHMFKVILLNFEEKGVKNILHHAKYFSPLPCPDISIYPPATRLFKMETALVFPKPVAFTMSELDRRLPFKSEYTRFSSSVRFFFFTNRKNNLVSSATKRTQIFSFAFTFAFTKTASAYWSISSSLSVSLLAFFFAEI